MLATATERLRFARALRSRPFALLWTGQTISALGDGAFFTALAWQVLLLTHSGTAMGLVAVAQAVPRVLFLLIGGVAADRLPRRLLMVWSDAGRAAAVLTIAALGWLGVLALWHLIVLAIVFGLADGFFTPAYTAIPPQLVAEDALTSANALTGLSRQASLLVGPALGATLVAWAGTRSAFAFDGLTFVASVLCLLAMPPLASVVTQPAAAALTSEETGTASTTGRGLRGVLSDMREGLRYVTRSSWLWVTIAVASVANVGWAGALVVAAPKLVHDFYHADVWLLGLIGTTNAVGSIVATLVVGHAKRLRHRGLLAYAPMVVSSVALAAFGLPWSAQAAPIAACTLSMIIGVGFGTFDIVWTTTLQEMVPPDTLGRVSSIDWMGSLLMTPLGFAAAGTLTDRIGPARVFIAAGMLNLLANLAGLSARGVRKLD